jgi:hypothetical protein
MVETMTRAYLNLECNGVLVFDGLQAVCWFVAMTRSASTTVVRNVAPGQLYTFVFTQGNVGGQTMTWPSNCINAGSIDLAPNAVTTITFIGNVGNMLYANISPTGYSASLAR